MREGCTVEEKRPMMVGVDSAKSRYGGRAHGLHEAAAAHAKRSSKYMGSQSRLGPSSGSRKASQCGMWGVQSKSPERRIREAIGCAS